MAATIKVRRLDPITWDAARGQGLSNFLTDIDAVAQIIQQRLLFLQGEWFANLADGTPIFQSILGIASTSQGVALLLRQRILGSPYVNEVSASTITYGISGRSYAYSATVQTPFGMLAISAQSGPGLRATVTVTPN